MNTPFPRLFLAPMAGYTDSAMRALSHRMGAEATVSEMISAKAVTYRDKKTVALGAVSLEEGPVLLQLFGKEPSVMAEAAGMLSAGYCGSIPFGIDINMGCPVPKIAGNGEGSALLRDPELSFRIVSAMRASLPAGMPLTCKLRLGYGDTYTVREVAAACVAGGADALFVHGRTRPMMYAGEADWEEIAAVRAEVSVPLIGNGDITSGEVARRRLLESGCYGLMVGRAAVGNPFLFAEIRAVLAGEAPPAPPTPRERALTALSHLEAAICDKGEAIAVRESRKQIAAYLRALPGAAALRASVMAAVTYREVEAPLAPWLRE